MKLHRAEPRPKGYWCSTEGFAQANAMLHGSRLKLGPDMDTFEKWAAAKQTYRNRLQLVCTTCGTETRSGTLCNFAQRGVAGVRCKCSSGSTLTIPELLHDKTARKRARFWSTEEAYHSIRQMLETASPPLRAELAPGRMGTLDEWRSDDPSFATRLLLKCNDCSDVVTTRPLHALIANAQLVKRCSCHHEVGNQRSIESQSTREQTEQTEQTEQGIRAVRPGRWNTREGYHSMSQFIQQTRFRLLPSVDSEELWVKADMRACSVLPMRCTLCHQVPPKATISNFLNGRASAGCGCGIRPAALGALDYAAVRDRLATFGAKLAHGWASTEELRTGVGNAYDAMTRDRRSSKLRAASEDTNAEKTDYKKWPLIPVECRECGASARVTFQQLTSASFRLPCPCTSA